MKIIREKNKKKSFRLRLCRRKYLLMFDDDEKDHYESFQGDKIKEIFLSSLNRRFERRGAICATDPIDSRVMRKSVQTLMTFNQLREIYLI